MVANRTFYRGPPERIAALPGVQAAGAVHNRPLEYGPIGSDNWVAVEGQPLDWDSVTKNSISVNWEAASPDYFRAVGTRLVEGRTFTERDTLERLRVVIVSQGLARRAWPGESPLGRGSTPTGEIGTEGRRLHQRRVVDGSGRWRDARYRGIQNPAARRLYPLHAGVGRPPPPCRPHARRSARAGRSRAGAGSRPLTRARVSASSPRCSASSIVPWRPGGSPAALLGGFALAALLLTASGLFAVLHHSRVGADLARSPSGWPWAPIPREFAASCCRKASP